MVKTSETFGFEGRFQTKLTYGMICYLYLQNLGQNRQQFQTKLTYGMICYKDRTNF